MKSISSFLIFILFFPVTAFCGHQYFDIVEKKLIKDGFDKSAIQSIYKNPGITFEFDSVALFFTVSEYKLNYDQFVSKKHVKNAEEYIIKNLETFKRIEKKYHVPKEIITAILTVETRLGKNTGNKKVFSVLSSIAALENKNVKKMVKKSIPSKKNRYSDKKYDARARKKSVWAYRELKNLVVYAEKNKIPLQNIKGSYAGATGIPQFMPSSILSHAKDGNNDKKIDLLNHEDAIASVAGYLRAHGWTKKIKKDIALKVIMKYNKSRPYAETVFNLAKKIREAEKWN